MGRLARHKVLVALVVAVLVLAAVVVTTVLAVDEPGPASVEDALERFQSEAGDDTAPEAVRPPAGVYEYRGEGGAQLSFPPLDQADGATMPGTVTHDAGGCWRFRLDYNEEHWQEWDYCPDGSGEGFGETGGRNGQQWDLGVSSAGNTSTFVCDPPNPVLGPTVTRDGVTQRCTGSGTAVEGSTTSTGPWRLVGPETLTVGEERVEVLHLRGERTLSGSQAGTEATEAWFRSDGLLVRYERDIEARTDTPVGAITYTESGWFELLDLRPRR